MTRSDRVPLFEAALLLSLLLHVAGWRALLWKRASDAASAASPLEIDLTRPFRLTSNPLLARRAEKPGAGAPRVEAPSTKPVDAAPPPAPPKEWVLPGPGTKELEKPVLEEPAARGPGGLGTGEGDGEVDWVYLTDLPRILNREELARNMRRYYPEAERRAGREGQVVLDIHIDEAGRVRGVDVSATAGAAFDAAARKVLAAARFSPARVGSKAVPVKIRQSIVFQLGE